MARGENPGQIISWTIHTNQAYDKGTAYGNENAEKDLMLGFDGDLVGNDELILGKFEDVDKNQEGSVMVTGAPMIMRQNAANAVAVGNKVVGAGNGQVKAAPGTAAGNTNGRGRVLEILENSANGRILVLMPAN